MKTLLALLLAFATLQPLSLSRAGDPKTNVAFTDARGSWTWKGQPWKGQVHKYVDGRVYVTGDRSAGQGLWLTAADLDPATRGWLGIGSAADDAAYAARAQHDQQLSEAARLQRLADAIAADEAAKARLSLLQRQRDAAVAAKAADRAEKQRAFDNYLRILEVQALERMANRR